MFDISQKILGAQSYSRHKTCMLITVLMLKLMKGAPKAYGLPLGRGMYVHAAKVSDT